jgi:hypothetical protein
VGEGFAVRAIRGQSVIDVRDLKDPGFEGNSFTAQSVGIAAAIHFFMMVTNDRENGAKRFERCADLFAGDRMFANDADFCGVERAGLEKDMFRNSNFADIVQPAGDAELENVFVAKAETSSQELGVVQKEIGMAVAEILFRVDAVGEGEKSGSSLFVHIGFEAKKSLDALKGVPEGGRSGPDIGGAGLVSAMDVPLVGRGFYQNDGRELIERIFFEATTKGETVGLRQVVVEKNQIRLELTTIADRGFGIVGDSYIVILVLKEML